MALIAEIVGGLGIIVSILYLGYEVSRNVERMEISHHLTLSDQAMSLRNSVLESGELADILVKGNADISTLEPYQRLQYRQYMSGWWDIWENASYMARIGQLDEGTWVAWNRAACLTTSTPGAKALWNDGYNSNYMEVFKPRVDECYAEANPQAATE